MLYNCVFLRGGGGIKISGGSAGPGVVLTLIFAKLFLVFSKL